MRLTFALLASLPSLLLGAACTGDEHCDEESGVCYDESGLFERAYDEGLLPGKEDGSDCSGVRVPDRSGFNKRVALTFDDGPNPETTPLVMEVLRRHNAPGTFFINGKKLGVAGAKEIAAEIAADPKFILANHSQGHLDLGEVGATDLPRVGREIDRTDEGIRAAGGTPKYFRFPFGSSTCGTMQLVRQRGLISTGWHIDSADWCFAHDGGVCTYETFKHVPNNMRQDMAAYVMSQVRANNGGVLLFHDIHAFTANSLDAILTQLEQAGYTFVRLDDTTAFPRLHGLTPPPQKFIGDVCMTDAQCGFSANGQQGQCHPAGFCTVACNGSCPDLDGRAATFCMQANPTTGMCVSKAAAQNTLCMSLPGTVRRDVDRFVGTSGVSPARASVCAPR